MGITKRNKEFYNLIDVQVLQLIMLRCIETVGTVYDVDYLTIGILCTNILLRTEEMSNLFFLFLIEK